MGKAPILSKKKKKVLLPFNTLLCWSWYSEWLQRGETLKEKMSSRWKSLFRKPWDLAYNNRIIARGIASTNSLVALHLSRNLLCMYPTCQKSCLYIYSKKYSSDYHFRSDEIENYRVFISIFSSKVYIYIYGIRASV